MAPHFDNREGYIWFNGDFVDWADVKLHVLSHALHMQALSSKEKESTRKKYLS